ncbi:MAG TPA: hypothetical protein VKX46_06805 [Ktedonobacteraceae bacterium]|nr:hypothetical protein [Ktedonobacteraceae bacterium]HLI68228.1 hypothetical protein [Ktedonobacteraceae bacterium]
MTKLTRTIIALALGLMIGLTMCTSGAFAQSISTNTPGSAAHATYQGYNQHGYNQWNDRVSYGRISRYRPRHVKCVRIVKYVRTRHFVRRVVYQSCRWV